MGHGAADVLSGIRQWRRWIQRAQELGLATPDPLVLVQVLNRVTEALGWVAVKGDFVSPSYSATDSTQQTEPASLSGQLNL